MLNSPLIVYTRECKHRVHPSTSKTKEILERPYYFFCHRQNRELHAGVWASARPVRACVPKSRSNSDDVPVSWRLTVDESHWTPSLRNQSVSCHRLNSSPRVHSASHVSTSTTLSTPQVRQLGQWTNALFEILRVRFLSVSFPDFLPQIRISQFKTESDEEEQFRNKKPP